MISRSTRKRSPKDLIDSILGSGSDQPRFEVLKINDKIGCGVFATDNFQKGDFLLEYAGERISEEEASRREESYKVNKIGCFIYYNITGKDAGKFCIDATHSKQAARFVNDAPPKYTNSIMKRYVNKNDVYVALFAKENIEKGTELRYDYSDEKEKMPWREVAENLIPKELAKIDINEIPMEAISPEVEHSSFITNNQEISKKTKSQGAEHCNFFANEQEHMKVDFERVQRCISSKDNLIIELDPGNFNDIAEGKQSSKITKSDIVTKDQEIAEGEPRKSKESDFVANKQEVANTIITTHDLEQKLNFLKVSLPINFKEKIGEGGSAIVSKFTIRDKPAAVKCWKQQLSKRKILNISEKLRKLSCPNIVRFRGFSIRPSAIVYEYCALQIEDELVTNVSQLIDIWNETENFEFSTRVSILKQALNGISYLHNMELVHQDIKPSNLLVSGTPDNIVVKVADFDDMFLIKNTIINTQTTYNCKGITLTYASPELCSRTVRFATKKCDVFSWAITAYEVMTGIQPPWLNVLPLLNDTLLCEAIRNGERPSLAEFDNKYSDEENDLIKPVITNAWKSDPTQRPSIHEILCFINEMATKKIPIIAKSPETKHSNFIANKQEIPMVAKSPGTEHSNFIGNKQECNKKCNEETQLQSIFHHDQRNSEENASQSFPDEIQIKNDSGFAIELGMAVMDTSFEETFETLDESDTQAQCSSDSDSFDSDDDDDNDYVDDSILSTDASNSADENKEGFLNFSQISVENKRTETDTDPPEKKICDSERNNSRTSSPVPDKTKKLPYKKPRRPCIFCSKLCTKLSLHISKKHKDNARVKKILQMKPKQRVEEFKKLRREGIVQFNKSEAAKENPCYQSERKKRKYFEIVLCSCCSAFISKHFFHAHKRRCRINNDQPALPIPMYLQDSYSKQLSKKFVTTVLSSLRDDHIGKLIRNDEYILYLGNKFFSKLQHKKEKVATVLKSVRGDMRMLASLYDVLCSKDGINKTHGNVLDMFTRENFDDLCDAVDSYTTQDGAMKSGLRQNLYFLLIKSCKRLRDRLFLEKKTEESHELESILRCFKSNEDILLSNAKYELEKTRARKNRKPCKLPFEDDLKKLHRYISSEINKICGEFTFWTAEQFIKLRNLTLARLTLFNGRRGNEVSRLLLEEWEDAEKDGYIDKEKLKKLSEADKLRVKLMKIAFLTGKGNKHMVSLLIPNNTFKAMNSLTNPEIRHQAGVSHSNIFVFASTQLSEMPFSGWHALKDVCEEVDLEHPELVNATNNRHKVSTEYAALDLPEQERNLFYKHMGHSAEMNKNVYQTPLAIMGITKVGQNLLRIEQGECSASGDGECVENYNVVTKKGYACGSTQHDYDNEEEEDTNGKRKKHIFRSKKRTDTSSGKVSDFSDYCSDSQSFYQKKKKSKKDYSLRRKRNLVVDSNDELSECSESQGIEQTKKKRFSKCKSDDNDCSNTDTDNDNDDALKLKRKNVRWTTDLHEQFMDKFDCYVRRESENAFPANLVMETFARKCFGPNASAMVIRTKINNERKKWDLQKNKNLSDIGLG